jgi:hypothetical protein
VEWIEDNCICGEGDWYGQPLKLRLEQQRFLYRWYEYCPKCGEWRANEGLRGAATGDGKTQFIAAIAVLEMAGPPQIAVPSPNIPIGAASFEQANLLFSAGGDDVRRAGPGGQGRAAVRVLQRLRHGDHVRGQPSGPDFPGGRGRGDE